ncbi:MAG: Fic family protein [Acidimicrobiia bacterium]
MIYQAPEAGPEKQAALLRIEAVWRALRPYVADRRRWVGSVRRVLSAVANQSSNSIEGYNISTEDAIAALQGASEPTESKWEDWQANMGYRRAMTYVLQLALDDHFEYSAPLLRSLHFMMTEYSFDAGPGLWRPGPIWVRNSASGEIVYEGPEAEYVPGLVDEVMDDLNRDDGCPPLVRAAMAHLNLVLVHPFRDGNGRMARCLQSLVLVREGYLAREFCSIEEYLGQQRNQQRYYDMLAEVARGHWTPENAARPWVRYCLEAHYVQALSVLRRFHESEQMWEEVMDLASEHGLPARSIDALFDAAVGLRVRNASYRASLESWGEEIANQTATNDLRSMVQAGLLTQKGSKRGTYYVAAEPILELRARIREPRTTAPINADGLFEPFPKDEIPLPSELSQPLELFRNAD